jgi:hypothetical protein
MSAASLNLTDSYVEPLEFGEVIISAELSTIPKLNSEQQKIGFGGLKYESLNKSPVFGRGKLKMGFYCFPAHWTGRRFTRSSPT